MGVEGADGREGVLDLESDFAFGVPFWRCLFWNVGVVPFGGGFCWELPEFATLVRLVPLESKSCC